MQAQINSLVSFFFSHMIALKSIPVGNLKLYVLLLILIQFENHSFILQKPFKTKSWQVKIALDGKTNTKFHTLVIKNLVLIYFHLILILIHRLLKLQTTFMVSWKF